MTAEGAVRTLVAQYREKFEEEIAAALVGMAEGLETGRIPEEVLRHLVRAIALRDAANYGERMAAAVREVEQSLGEFEDVRLQMEEP